MYQDLGRSEAALKLNQRAIALAPENAGAHNNLGVCLRALGRFEGASQAYRKSIKINPHQPHQLANLATSLAESDQIGEAIDVCLKAHKRWPDQADILNALANAHVRRNELDQALETLDRVLAIDPGHVNAHYAKGMTLLAIGDFAEGWREYEWRTKRPQYWPHKKYQKPLWLGAPLKGKTLLVHWEQGFGDNINFFRYLQHLRGFLDGQAEHQGARILFDCPRLLLELFSGSVALDEIGDYGNEPPAHDCHIPLMSLAQRMGTTPENIPGYLKPLGYAIEGVHRVAPAAPGTLKVGLVWASDHGDSYRRKVCPMDQLARLFEIENCIFYGLQYGPQGDELKAYENPDKVINLGGELDHFAHNAALTRQMDLIIAIDTYIVHLAGAMDLPAWVMLPYSPDWRWLHEGSPASWYPSLRLFRQPAPGDWRGLISEVASALGELAG